MELKTPKDLAKIVDLCRKKGIESIKITADCVEFKLAAEPPKKSRKSKASLIEEEVQEIKYTEDDMLFWSSPRIEELN